MVFVVGAALCWTACGGDEGKYDVPNKRWSVRLVAAQHTGQPLMRIRVNDGFEWPLRGDDEPILYQVRLTDDTGARIDGVGWVDEASRRGVVVMVSDWVIGELAVDTSADDERVGARRTALSELAADTTGTTVSDLEKLFDLAETIDVGRGAGGRMDERTLPTTYELELVPYFDGAELSHEGGNKHTPQPIALDWGQPLSDFPGCAEGIMPIDCVRNRIDSFGTILCDERTEANTPRFPELCTQVSERLERQIAEPDIACALPDESGVTASIYDPVNDAGTINGGHVLAGFDGDAAFMHQLSHAQSLTENQLMELVNVRKADGEIIAALAAGRAAAANNDYDTARAEADKLVAAARTLLESELVAAAEMADSECRALVTTMEAADLFGYPEFGDAWLFGAIINGVAELSGLRRDYYQPMDSPAVTGQLCGCMSLVADWVEQRPSVYDGLSQTIVSASNPVTAVELIDGLAASYCGS